MRARRSASCSRARRRGGSIRCSKVSAWRWASSRCSTWPASTSGVNVHKTNAHAIRRTRAYYQADIALYAAGRLGQKTGKGYYRYEKGDRTRHDDPEALALIARKAASSASTPRAHTDEEILERCMFPLLNEGMRILEEGIAQRASDIDVVWAAGYGFPRYRGGPDVLRRHDRPAGAAGRHGEIPRHVRADALGAGAVAGADWCARAGRWPTGRTREKRP